MPECIVNGECFEIDFASIGHSVRFVFAQVSRCAGIILSNQLTHKQWFCAHVLLSKQTTRTQNTHSTHNATSTCDAEQSIKIELLAKLELPSSFKLMAAHRFAGLVYISRCLVQANGDKNTKRGKGWIGLASDKRLRVHLIWAFYASRN